MNNIVVTIPNQPWNEEKYDGMIADQLTPCYLKEALIKLLGHTDIMVGAWGYTRIKNQEYETVNKFNRHTVEALLTAGNDITVELKPIS